MPDSALGFGVADWIALALAALLILLAAVWSPSVRHRVNLFAARTRLVMPVLFAIPIAMRLLLLAHHPVPTPQIYDEFSHLLLADTLLLGRLANPPHAMHEFFETFFVLQEPTYSSIYPLGQGLVLALGRAVSGSAWTGVLLVGGALCAFCYWMLRAYVEPCWALLGGLLAIAEFGPLNGWMNSYWGGGVAALGGCLVFGSLARLARRIGANDVARTRDAMLLACGFGMNLLTRQFESTLLLAGIVLFVTQALRSRDGRIREDLRVWLKALSVAFVAVLPVLVLISIQNKQVTGRWNTLPEQLSQEQYGVPTTLTIQAPASPHIALTREQELDYRAQALTHGRGTDTVARFLLRLEYRVRDYRFFFLPPLYLACMAFLFTLRNSLHWWVVATLGLFALGTNLFPYLLVHYLAAVTCLFLLVSVIGLKRVHEITVRGIAVGVDIVRVLVTLCFMPFLLWYTLHLCENGSSVPALLRYETWDSINHAEARGRVVVNTQLAAMPGRLLVFVHYTPQHVYQDEWVWNGADIDGSRVVWARDLGEPEDEKLIHYYPGRKVLLLEPDSRPPRLSVFSSEPR